MTLEQRLQQYIQAGNSSISNELLLHYQDIGLDNDDLVLYFQVQRIQDRGDQATPAAVAQIMHTTEKVVIQRLQSLIKRELMQVKGGAIKTEVYDFTPLFDKLLGGTIVEHSELLSDGKSTRRQIMQTLESEFGRPLSPMEMQTISHWFDQDHFEPVMMMLAIQEAVANNARSLRYIETILTNWQRDNITTPQAAEVAKQRRRGVTYTNFID
ncbi:MULTISPECIES: DnaD domain protein [Leuconostoc]|uniref:DnaD domain protein n=1 Tax=Leuconostoc TaxID=1243 RepID=UPI00111F97FA|nr:MULTISPECIES: DnaD domain protein [Leuconostoc]MBK0040214.1 DnaD domain protein [Leuconostoc sp. S51]MBK0051173.1 DnaD domain protein [Leuconostoc sp. S50]TOZ04847.1 DNA replication protein DnaD [Leuconostoc pseudomesenteroides]